MAPIASTQLFHIDTICSDIDIVILSRAMETVTKRKVLYRLAQVMRSANITDNVQVIGKAKVPIIKFVTSHGACHFQFR